jgi:molybdenum cofactor synthesis domain-containing protein
MARDTVTAGVLLIGDELLSGRTKDVNLGYIAERLTDMAIELREARMVPDIEEEIVAAVNALRARYDYVFTTGGIGPTHDDITADAVAKAFGTTLEYHEATVASMRERYHDEDINEARMRMARVPVGGDVIANAVSWAPGLHIGNVYVMAGIPRVMQAMFDAIAPTLERGKPLLSRTVKAFIGEGDLAQGLQEIQDRYPDVAIGSYPFHENGRFGANLVVRSKDEAALEAAEREVAAMVEAIGPRELRLKS